MRLAAPCPTRKVDEIRLRRPFRPENGRATVITVQGLAVAMVVKSVRGRRRYVSFSVPPETSRDDVLAALSAVDPPVPDLKVITCKGGKAVVRCPPKARETVSDTLSRAIPGSRSLNASGTLRALRTADPDLKVPGRRRRRHLF